MWFWLVWGYHRQLCLSKTSYQYVESSWQDKTIVYRKTDYDKKEHLNSQHSNLAKQKWGCFWKKKFSLFVIFAGRYQKYMLSMFSKHFKLYQHSTKPTWWGGLLLRVSTLKLFIETNKYPYCNCQKPESKGENLAYSSLLIFYYFNKCRLQLLTYTHIYFFDNHGVTWPRISK